MIPCMLCGHDAKPFVSPFVGAIAMSVGLSVGLSVGPCGTAKQLQVVAPQAALLHAAPASDRCGRRPLSAALTHDGKIPTPSAIDPCCLMRRCGGGQVLSDVLAGKRASVGAGESPYWRTFGGDQSPEDLETALQLVHRLFTTQVPSRITPPLSPAAAFLFFSLDAGTHQGREGAGGGCTSRISKHGMIITQLLHGGHLISEPSIVLSFLPAAALGSALVAERRAGATARHPCSPPGGGGPCRTRLPVLH